MNARFSAQERTLLVLLQDQFPLAETPFAILAERLGVPEREVLADVVTLKASGIVRQIGAIFDSRRLGYSGTLAALSVLPERLETVAAVISRHPGVTHNYSRDHDFNLWFTLAVPPGYDLEGELRDLVDQAGVLQYLSLPTTHTFKIDARFTVDGESGQRRTLAPETGLCATSRAKPTACTWTVT